ncbi:hypothetical protein BO70DRAFT_385470 [Aspergillus heteromorphus CBS 117.55]|uniref:Zn(2)-C6 fungal-type domain-containing protein n=1 Tax=Aspergillus heteromorphus CBS 117.55 TaxID=1448321 RepID=A0A317WSE1_9EURO|nr:uncharacterized protein BO70DRAFT_385470 [Aspergillus heteromorphus CBS 117.55]PWY88252.1 hypothetical protein BO70DRAFT_385470 [Aspergillus heteromorphus CBS 117.55]
MPSTHPEKIREGKAPRRSRYGCRNCKLRKLKCDEAKPQCKRCCSFGLLCNFVSNVPDLQPVAADTGRKWVDRGRGNVALQPALTHAVWTSDASTCYHLDARSQDLVYRYLGCSLITPADPGMREVNRGLLGLAFDHPYLMHASLAIALTYDRHLNGPLTHHHKIEEYYHRSQSTILLNNQLQLQLQSPLPLSSKTKDAIWGTAAAQTILTFSYPPPLTALCALTPSSTAESSPYFLPAHALAQILRPDNQVTVVHVQLFMGSIHNQKLMDLLRGKDRVALALLYLWYRRVGRCVWWVGMRARVEGRAIGEFLMRREDGDGVQLLLPD